MMMSATTEQVAPASRNVLTVQEALEPLYLRLEVEAEMRLIRAAVQAGWSAEEAVDAIEELRRQDIESPRH